MNNNHHEHLPMAGRSKIAWIVFAAIAAFYLLSEHRAHLMGALPFLLQWPTLLTVVMFPILVIVYARLAHREEAEAATEFGADYAAYRTRTPALWPW